MANAINWFEIPAANFNRAMKFYGEVVGENLQPVEMGGVQMGFFPYANEGVGGAICFGDGYVPSDAGSMIYLNGGEDLAAPLGRVEKAGGQVVLPKTQISEEIGYFAIFKDSEGNKVAFHSPK